jgi:hypothetical protein
MKRKRPAPDREQIARCLEMVSSGLSVRSASRELGLAKSTVLLHQKALQSQTPLASAGCRPFLPSTLCEEIASLAKESARHGFGLSKKELTNFVRVVVLQRQNGSDEVGEYLRYNCRFVDGVPSHKWVEKFMRDHSLSLKKPTPLERCRVKSTADPVIVYDFYDLLEEEMERLDITNKPNHVYNLDETCFFIDPTRGKVVAEVGRGGVHRITAGPCRQNFTVMACISANGTCQPPLVIFAAKHLYSTWRGRDPIKGMTYAVSDSGWMNTEIFESWFTNFIKVVPQRPLLIIFDGHKTHLGLPLIHRARQEGISLLKLPSHTTSKLQPLDVSCFRPLKLAWDQQLVKYQREKGFLSLSKSEFVDQLCQVWPHKFSVSNIQNGFRKTGIFPVDRSQFPLRAFHPAKLRAYNAHEHTPGESAPLEPPAVNSHLQQIPTKPTPLLPESTPSAEDELVRLQEMAVKFSQQLGAYMIASGRLPPSSERSTSSQQPPEPVSVSDIFFNLISPTQIPQTVASKKRKRINQCAAVITSDEYLEAIEAQKKSTSKKQRPFFSCPVSTVPKKRLPVRRSLAPTAVDEEDGADSDKDLPHMPPPLPKAQPTPPSPRLPRLPRKPRSTLSPSSHRLQRKPRSTVKRSEKAACSNASPHANVDKFLQVEIESEACLYCTEPHGSSGSREKWLRCRVCLKWAHNLCAGISPSLTTFVSELCF